MRKLLLYLLLLLASAPLTAQTRTYSDNASGTFVFGLDHYFYGASGSLTFSADGHPFEASLLDGTVRVNGTLIAEGSGDTLIGLHDFTGNASPELVVARRNGSSLKVGIYTLSSGTWTPVGEMQAEGNEVRVFRQVLSIRSGDTLNSWTWHDSRFDFKRSR